MVVRGVRDKKPAFPLGAARSGCMEGSVATVGSAEIVNASSVGCEYAVGTIHLSRVCSEPSGRRNLAHLADLRDGCGVSLDPTGSRSGR